jgi:hypothetical protein
MALQHETVSVDLKWSLWSTHRDHWDEYAPGLWDMMEAAFNGLEVSAPLDPQDQGDGAIVTVNTAPRKEIRYGTVTIAYGYAEVDFWTEPDDEYDQEHKGRTYEEADLHWGGRVELDPETATFEDLMALIDAEEDKLIEWEQTS